MRKLFAIIVILFSQFSLFSQTHEIVITNENFINIYTNIDENGVNSTNYELKTNIEDGKYFVYSDSSKSKLVLVGEITNNQKNGTWEYFYSNGSIMKITNFRNNEKEGKETIFYSNKNIKELRNYTNNMLNGYRIFYKNNNVEEYKINYDMGIIIKN